MQPLIFGFLSALSLSQQIEFRQGFSGCADVVVTANAPFDGMELAWQYEALEPPSVTVGPDLPAGAFLAINLVPPNGCANTRAGVAVGIVVGTTPLPAGTYRVLEVCHPLAPNISTLCGNLDWVDCLGAPPITNRLFPGPVDLVEKDGQVCFFEKPFRRGDLDGDGKQTVGDAVDILHCLFLQDRCPGCFDVADANDDGVADISDVVFLLSWRVGLVPALPPPSGACGSDPTPDQFLCPDRGGATCAWVELKWDAPTLNEDGTPLMDLAGFRIYSGLESRNYDQSLDVGLKTAAAWIGEKGSRRYFTVTALNDAGKESTYSNEVWK